MTGWAWQTASRIDTASAASARPIVQRVDALPEASEHALGRPIDVQSWGSTAAGKRAPGLQSR